MSEKEDLAGKFVSPIRRRVETTTGHVLVFEANEPLYVAPVCRREMFALGILPADGAAPPKEMIGEEKEEPVPDPVGLDRVKQIHAVFAKLMDMNNVDDFNATGMPKVAVVSKQCGFKVSSKELTSEWKAYKAELAATT